MKLIKWFNRRWNKDGDHRRFRLRFVAGTFIILYVIILPITLLKLDEAEMVYIQEEPQITKVIRNNDPIYIDIYKAPCRDNPDQECAYIKVYPNEGEEIEE